MNILSSYRNFILLGVTSLAVGAGCALSGQGRLQIPCPETMGTVKGDDAADSMPINSKEVILVCGHREDGGDGALMRLSEFEIIRYDVENDNYMKVWSARELEVRYVKLHKKEKTVELVQSIFGPDDQPVPIIREQFLCAGEKCETGPASCLFKRDFYKYQPALPKKTGLRDWLQYQDSEKRAAVIFLTAASGHKPSVDVIYDKSMSKLREDGHFANVMQGYRLLLDRTKNVCKGH